MRRGTAILAILAALAAGIGIGYSLAGRAGSTTEGPAGATDGTSAAEVADLRAERDEALRKLAAAQAKSDAGESLPASGEGAGEASPAGPEGATEGGPAGEPGPRFFSTEYDGALRDIDWKSIGENMAGMAEVIRELTPSLRKGEPPSPEVIGRAQQLNGPLLTAALKLPENVPGTGPNGRFSNPAFMANAIAATLESAGKPLTDAQARRLSELSREYLSLDDRRRAGYDDGTLDLVKLVEEAELKDRWFRDVFAMLEPAQVELLSPADARGRVRIDVFSSSLLFVGRVGIFTFSDRDDLVEKVTGRLASTLGFDDTTRQAARPIVDTWAGGIPEALLGEEWNRLDGQGMVTAKRAIAWGKQDVELLRKFEAGLSLTPAQSKTLRDMGGVWVPLRGDARID